MADWHLIEPTRVEVIGVNPQAEGLLDVAVLLSNTPPAGWAERFHSCSEIPVPINLRASWHVQGDRITVTVVDGSMEGWVAKIKECIARANSLYELEVLPVLNQREEAERRRQADAERRLEEARRKAENL
jgi:hypothetical protein